jgi:phospholipid/cholesterol/gamma-HCH transport system permease protein
MTEVADATGVPSREDRILDSAAGDRGQPTAGFSARREAEAAFLDFDGTWTIETVGPQDAALRQASAEFARGGYATASLDISRVARLDSAGAWLIHRTREQLAAAGLAVTVAGGSAAQETLIAKTGGRQAPAPLEPQGRLVLFVAHIGWSTLRWLETGRDLLGFLGLTVVALGGCLLKPARLRFTSVLVHMERTGLDALPIVGLLSFLIGVVLAYQGSDQLARFGAEIFTVNLVGISILREMGILITAIVVAGRSGSAYTAQIGTMKVNQEVDAMLTIGLDPVAVLVVPRVLALMITLPLLTFYADIMGLLGGATMSWAVLDIDPLLFARRLNEAVTPMAFWVGMIKAPIFAFVIALVGCFEGLQVTGNAESVGHHTTRAVVEAIFLVIVLDAMFSIFFSVIGV